ncbi:MAG: DUF2877 domain-containing protein [Thermodesulfobacteriota bacterium]|nr:DUF2877 domain-containing protein [Thermodesulfobacteriota bacterium]
MASPSKTNCPEEIFNRRGKSELFTWRARSIGAKAKSLLATPGFSGQILAALSDVAYLSGKDGDILWLVREGVPLHRRGILVSFMPRSLCLGQNFFVEGHSLRIGRDTAVDLSQAAEWKPDTPRPAETGPLAKVNDCVRQLLEAISVAIGDDGPGRVIPMISSIVNGRNLASFPPGSWSNQVVSPILDLVRLWLSEGLAQVGTRGRELVGLGQGLTPCGEDFLGGLLFTAYWLNKAYPGYFRWEPQPIFDLIDWARTRTHPISHAILGDLAKGQGPEPLHDLVLMLLKGEDPGQVMAGINRLLRVGHTTGWYMLAGVLTGMLSVDGKLN